jgi:hypothetical protein
VCRGTKLCGFGTLCLQPLLLLERPLTWHLMD